MVKTDIVEPIALGVKAQEALWNEEEYFRSLERGQRVYDLKSEISLFHQRIDLSPRVRMPCHAFYGKLFQNLISRLGKDNFLLLRV